MEVPSSRPVLFARFVLGSPEFNSPVTLIICVQLVGILDLMGHSENYWFISNCVAPIKSEFSFFIYWWAAM